MYLLYHFYVLCEHFHLYLYFENVHLHFLQGTFYIKRVLKLSKLIVFKFQITENPMYMIIVNGGFSIQSYFAMAAWLLTYNFFLAFEGKKKMKLSYILFAFFNRYIRYSRWCSVNISIILLFLQINSKCFCHYSYQFYVVISSRERTVLGKDSWRRSSTLQNELVDEFALY